MVKDSNKKPWRRNVESFIILYSILAALGGILLSTALLDVRLHFNVSIFLAFIFAFSIFTFILSAEKILDALDEDDIEKYLAWLLVYNIGSIILIAGIALLIYFHYFNKVIWWHIGILIIIIIILCYKWISDILFLLFKNEETYNDYKEELQGEKLPEPAKDWLTCFHKWIRKTCHKK